MDRYVLFHELAHLLHADTAGRRSLTSELAADARALDLMCLYVQHGPLPADPSAFAADAWRQVVLGGPSFLQLLRIITLFTAAHRALAVMGHVAFAGRNGPLISAGDSLRELEIRLASLVAAAHSRSPGGLGPLIAERAASLGVVYISASSKLLMDASVAFELEELLAQERSVQETAIGAVPPED